LIASPNARKFGKAKARLNAKNLNFRITREMLNKNENQQGTSYETSQDGTKIMDSMYSTANIMPVPGASNSTWQMDKNNDLDVSPSVELAPNLRYNSNKVPLI
jgi:hypothetical protein